MDTEDFEDEDTERSEYDFFHRKHEHEILQAQNQKRRQHHEQEYTETEREEVQCSEWGDHYSTTSTSDEEEGDTDTRSEIGTRSNFGSSMRAESVTGASTRTAATAAPKMHRTASKTEKSDDAGSSASYRTGDVMDMKMVVRHKDLKEIVEAIKENFEKAATAGDQVSEMLEISRDQLDRSFRQLRSKLIHSF